jgi:DNA-binding CsgD family transcriptional regulator
MLTSHPSKFSEPPPLPGDAVRQRIEELIREFVGRIAGSLEPSPRSGQVHNQEEIIIDTIVDGARYLLIRMSALPPLLVSLTPREQEIVRMVAKGYPNKTIAGFLNISSWTVGTHLRRIFAKLGVVSRAAMIARIMEEYPMWNHSPIAEGKQHKAADPSTGTRSLLRDPELAGRYGFASERSSHQPLDHVVGHRANLTRPELARD